jgi:NAD(P)-dependent dehydrogenase (short-subunit alcohol dehydrogenase family)
MKGSHMQTKNVVMVAGAHGVSGRAAAEHWTRKPGTQVFGLSRRTASLPPGVQGITADLLDRKGLEEKIGRIKGVTHIVFAAYIEKPTAVERSENTKEGVFTVVTLHSGQRNAHRSGWRVLFAQIPKVRIVLVLVVVLVLDLLGLCVETRPESSRTSVS